VAEEVPAFKIERMDDGALLQLDLGETDTVYISAVTS
jgi:hypothetical protein